MAGQTRVFISYSNKDSDLVANLKRDLAAAGVAVWLDHEQLTPDTLDWQDAVRRGVAQATHVIYVASPTAARSQYVIHEITMAREEGKTVLAFWIRGDKWYDCTPMGWILAQYTDGRGAAYASGVARLLTALGVCVPAPTSAPAAAPAPTAPPPRPPQQRSDLLPTVPVHLAGLGFRGVNLHGMPVIIAPLVPVAAGFFLMGSDKAKDKEAWDEETPQHRVELAAFQIGKYPVTVAEYALAIQAGAVREPLPGADASWEAQLQRLDHPVVNVSWQNAQAYVAWLREATGEPGWRLPSEAEWEKAARWEPRQAVSRIYPWGNTFDHSRCNTSESGLRITTPVGSYPASDERSSGASPYGAEDMSGNVWEWTRSAFKPYPYAPGDGRENLSSDEHRTLRGGSWYYRARSARASYRLSYRSDTRENDVGFRLALSPSAGS